MPNNNKKMWRIIGVVVMVILSVVAVAYGYGRLNGRFEALEKKVEKTEDTRERLIRVEEGVEYLKKGVDDIKKELKDDRRRN